MQNFNFSAVKAMHYFTAIFTKLLVTSLLVTTAQVQAESVEFLSSELLQQEGEDAYWQATVRCKGSSTGVMIRQKLKQDAWCVTGDKLPCQLSKSKMAEQVCLNVGMFPEPAKTVRKEIRPTVLSTTSIQAKPAKTSDEANAKAKQGDTERERLAQAAELKAEELTLQEERARLEQEKLAVQQAELELEIRAKEIERQLKSVNNQP